MLSKIYRQFAGVAFLCGGMVGTAMGHGDVAPQAVDTAHLPQLGEEWLEVNPYRDNADAVETGASAYNQNCT